MEKHHYTGILGIIVGVIFAIGLVFYFKHLGVKTLYIGENPKGAIKESSQSPQQQTGNTTNPVGFKESFVESSLICAR